MKTLGKLLYVFSPGIMRPQENTGMPGAEDGAKGLGPPSELPRVVQSKKGPPAESATSTPPARLPSYAGVATVKPSAIPPQVRHSNGTAPGSTPPGRQTDDGEVAHLRRALEAARKESEQRFAALQDAEQRHAQHIHHVESESRAQNKRLLGIMATERERAARAEAELKGTRQLLQARTTELAAAQAFFGPADELSERDIATRVETLNEEIFQLSAQLADSVQLATVGRGTVEAQEVASKAIGEYICKGLSSGEEDARLGLLQVAMQAAATHWSQTHIQRWTENIYVDRYARHLHKIVRQSEKPDVAKRWRVITQKSLLASDGDDEIKLVTSLCNAVDVVTKAAACVPKNVKGDADLQQALQEGAQAVVRLTLQLRRDISIGITSTQLSTIHPRPGQAYYSATMEVEDAAQKRKGSTVGCGISLGLVRDQGTSQKHTLIKSDVFIVPE